MLAITTRVFTLESDIVSIYGNVKINQGICRRCKSRFFILDKKQNRYYCEDCLPEISKEELNNVKESKKTKIVYHITRKISRYISKKMRREVYERDNYECVYCGKDLYDDYLSKTSGITIDHFFPFIRGGQQEIDNLNTCCARCNTIKRAKIFETISDFKKYLQERQDAKKEINH